MYFYTLLINNSFKSKNFGLAIFSKNLAYFRKLKSEKRQGITERPMGTGQLNPQLVCPVLHLKINSLKWCQQAAYTFNARNEEDVRKCAALGIDTGIQAEEKLIKFFRRDPSC